MQEFEFENFAKHIAGVGLSFDKELKPEQILIYWEVLKEEFESIEDFKKAVAKLLKSWRYSYMPKPAHFIEAAQDTEELELIALKAYNKAKETAIAYGVYKNLEFDDPFIAETILTLFGSFKEFHDNVAYADSDDTWVKRDFITLYKKIAKNQKVSGKKLIGYLQKNFSEPIVIHCDYVPPRARQKYQEIALKVKELLPNKRV